MTIFGLLGKIMPYVKPYRGLVTATLTLTFIGSLLAQVNAVVLDRTVDAVNALISDAQFEWTKAMSIIAIITAILLGKEVLAALTTFA